MSTLRDEERDPLLQSEDRQQTAEDKSYRQGPLEISRTTRYGILAGIWAATFLSVCKFSHSLSRQMLSTLPLVDDLVSKVTKQ